MGSIRLLHTYICVYVHMEIHVSPFIAIYDLYPYTYGSGYIHTLHWIYMDTSKMLLIRMTCHTIPLLYSFPDVLLPPWQDSQVFSECYICIV